MSANDPVRMRQARDAAMKRVWDHADPIWIGWALEGVLGICLSMTRFVPADHVWPVVPPCREPRALGPIMVKAVKAGWCELEREHTQTERIIAHGRPMRWYTSLVYGRLDVPRLPEMGPISSTEPLTEEVKKAQAGDGEHPLVALNELRMGMGKEPLLHLPKWDHTVKIVDGNPLARGIGGKAFVYGEGAGMWAVLCVKSHTQVPGFDPPYRWASPNDWRCEKVVGRNLAQIGSITNREAMP